MTRYSRQLTIPEIGTLGQELLKSSKVLCVGVGGLGSPVSLYLAAAGVGTLGLIDPDTVETSNLQRQILFKSADEGKSKVHTAKQKIHDLNPEVAVHTYYESLHEKNAEFLFNQYDLVIDGTDNFTTKFLINDAAHKTKTPMIYGAVNRFEGQVAFFNSTQGSCYRCLYPAPPKAKIKNCAESGVLGSVVGVVGTLQSTLALGWLISQGNESHPLFPKTGALTYIDLKGGIEMRSVLIPKHPHCPTCSIAPKDVKILGAPDIYQTACSYNATAVHNIHTHELADLLLKNQEPSLLLLDVREEDEWNAGHIQGAFHLPLSKIESGEIDPFTQTEKIIVYCQSGLRSKAAALKLVHLWKHTSIYNLVGGIQSWPETLVMD